MFSFIRDILELGEKLFGVAGKARQRYGKDSELAKTYPGKTPFGRFLIDANDILLVLLGSALVLGVMLRVWIIYNHQAYRYRLKDSVGDFYRQALTTKLTILAVAIGVFGVMFLYVYWVSVRGKFRVDSNLVFNIALVGVALFTLTPTARSQLDDYLESEAFYRAEQSYSEQAYGESIGIFNALVSQTDDAELKDSANDYIEQILATTADPQDRVSVMARVLVQAEDPDPEDVYRVRAAIYDLGLEHDLDEAIAILDEIRRQFPTDELDPFWLGISQARYSLFLNDNVYELEALPEQRIKLRTLLIRYPSSPLADLAKLLLGDHRYMADNEPNSTLRDWALYKTGGMAYFDKDFDTAISYFSLFLQEYPSHRWADDAGYRLARSYELTGDFQAALFQALDSVYFLDGDMKNILESYALALVDTYYDAEQLEALIDEQVSPGNQRDLPLLEFCLAEQLFKESRLVESQEQFRRVQKEYPGSYAAGLVEINLSLLDSIFGILEKDEAEAVFELARLFMSEQGDPGLIFYNELYTGRRTQGLANIGSFGPDGDYFLQNNDHLRAAKILEDFARANPDHPRAAEALYWANLAYYELTLPRFRGFLPDGIGGLASYTRWGEVNHLVPSDQPFLKQNLERISELLLFQYPNSPYTPEAITISAIGIHNYDSDLDDVIRLMDQVVKLYPEHSLANNALIYIARIQRARGDRELDATVKYFYYRQAELAYQRILDEYPLGHVGDEAEEEVTELQQKMGELNVSH